MLSRSEMMREAGRENLMEGRIEAIEGDLDIMDRYPLRMQQMEDSIVDDFSRRDREYKDAHLHSIPRPRKHSR